MDEKLQFDDVKKGVLAQFWNKNKLILVTKSVSEQLLSPNETVVIYRRNSCSMAYATVVPFLLYTCDIAVVRQ